MKPFINWDELRKLGVASFAKPVQAGENIWDKSAAMYNQMAAMEREYTLAQVDAIGLKPTDTVLDIGCGPGRLSCLIAPRVRSVTALDSSEKMLELCKSNIEQQKITNIAVHHMDWKDVVPGKNIKIHDVAIACRTSALGDIEKLNAIARRVAVFIAWANAPSIPVLLNELFEGTTDTQPEPLMHDRRLGYNVLFNMVYDFGAEPNIHIVRDGFTKDYASRDEAYKDLRQLRPFSEKNLPRFMKNVDALLTPNTAGGVTFRRETRSFVLWWETIHKQ